MRAIVLSGGGAKGAYEFGVWKALRNLKIKYDIVTGTSIGALNGLLMAQNDYYKALNLWNKVDFNMIYENFDDKDIYKEYLKNIKNGGINTTKIENIINKIYNPKKLKKTKIKYGVVSVNLSNQKVKNATTENTKNLSKYILASAMAFPVFKAYKIDNDMYIDGGFYDNLPINLAISLGATEIIAVDLQTIGVTRKVEKDAKVIYIKPSHKLVSFLDFDNTSAKKMIKLGYNDTMKKFHNLDGNLYTFKKNILINNYKKYYNDFMNYYKKYYNDNITYKQFNNIIESAFKVYDLDFYKVYNKDFNSDLLDNLNLETKKITKKITVKKIYDKLLNNEDCTIFTVFKKEFQIAIYLIIIRRKI